MLSYLRVFINRDRIVISCALRLAWLKASVVEAADESFQLCITLSPLGTSELCVGLFVLLPPIFFLFSPLFLLSLYFSLCIVNLQFPASTEICIKSISLIVVLPKSLQN